MISVFKIWRLLIKANGLKKLQSFKGGNGNLISSVWNAWQVFLHCIKSLNCLLGKQLWINSSMKLNTSNIYKRNYFEYSNLISSKLRKKIEISLRKYQENWQVYVYQLVKHNLASVLQNSHLCSSHELWKCSNFWNKLSVINSGMTEIYIKAPARIQNSPAF